MAISLVGTNVGTSTCTITAHSVGDLILVLAFRNGSNSTPTVPAGFTTIQSVTSNSAGSVMAYKIATATNDTSGTWTNGTNMIIGVYTGTDTTRPIGGSQVSTGTGTTVTYPALTMVSASGTSWVAGLGTHRSTNTTINTAPTGMTNRNSSTVVGTTSFNDTNGGVTGWSVVNQSVGGTSSGWGAYTVEILPAGSTTTYEAAVLADSPVSYWRLGEPSGTTAFDVFRAHNGTYTNSPTLGVTGAISGDPNTAMTVARASSQYVDAGSIGLAAANFSVEAWINFGAANVNAYAISEGNTASTNPIWGISLDNIFGLQVGFFVRDASLNAESLSTGAINDDGKWHHVVATVAFGTPTTSILYFDGVQVATSSAVNVAALSTVNTFSIGALYRTSVGNYWNGSIDEVAIYHGVLSSTRVAAHYAAAPQVFTSSLSGGLSFVGAMSKQTAYPLTATASSSGTLARVTARALPAAVLSFAGAFSKFSSALLSATLSFAGTISRVASYPLSASLSFVGNLNRFDHWLQHCLSVAAS